MDIILDRMTTRSDTRRLIEKMRESDKITAGFLEHCENIVKYVDVTNSAKLILLKVEVEELLHRMAEE